MNPRRLLALSPFCLMAAGLLAVQGCSSKPGEPGEPESVGSIHQEWQIIFGHSHGNQEKSALYFLKPEIREALADAITRPDLPWTTDPESVWNGKNVGTQMHSDFHFDNCRFKEATTLLRKHYEVIVDGLDQNAGPYSRFTPAWARAVDKFGFILHASQDFYAHSNWVESGESDLVDSSLEAWNILEPNESVGKRLQVIEVPGQVSGSLDRNTHVLTLTGAARPLGLLTGKHKNADHDGGTGCPQPEADPPVSMKHGAKFSCEVEDLKKACEREGICGTSFPGRADCSQIWRRTYMAKDHSPGSIPGGPIVDMAQYKRDMEQRIIWREKAFDLALRQTKHEFCRLTSLMKAKYGDAGKERIYQAWVDDRKGADAACPGVYADATASAKLLGVVGSRISVADLNGDNYPDLIVRDATEKESDFGQPRQGHVRALVNDRAGGFNDVSASSGLFAPRTPGATSRNQRRSQVMVFGDIDNDGDVDAFAGSPPYTPQGLSGTERPELLRNDGNGVFSRYTTYPMPVSVYPGGASFVDVDRDGRLDLFVPARDPMTTGSAPRGAGWLFKGTGSSTAPLSNATSSITSAAGYFQASVACDLNGDGRPELMAPAVDRGPSRLWQARPDGTYQERGVESGFASDALTSYQDSLPFRAYCAPVTQRDRVWDSFWSSAQSCPGGTVAGCPADCRTTFPCDSFRAATAADRTACAGAAAYPSSRAKEQLIDAAAWVQTRDSAPARLGGRAFSVLCVDFDGDGKLDILQTSQRSSGDGTSADPVRILRNVTASAAGSNVALAPFSPEPSGLATFHALGLDWLEASQSAAAFDMNNDGRPDLLLNGATGPSSYGRLLSNTSTFTGTTPLSFADVDLPTRVRSEGVIAADFDRDGDLDLVVGKSCLHPAAKEECDSEQVQLLRNELVQTAGTRWLQLKLVGRGGSGLSNKSAIGARVSITVNGRTVVQEVGGGHGSFGSQSDLVLHFGLGSATSVPVVSVRWPTNRAQPSENIPPSGNSPFQLNKAYRIEEGASGGPATVTELTLPPP